MEVGSVEYRLVNRDLVLIDLHANLVVDILRTALPPKKLQGVYEA